MQSTTVTTRIKRIHIFFLEDLLVDVIKNLFDGVCEHLVDKISKKSERNSGKVACFGLK